MAGDEGGPLADSRQVYIDSARGKKVFPGASFPLFFSFLLVSFFRRVFTFGCLSLLADANRLLKKCRVHYAA